MKINPKQMEQIARKMGMQTETIEAEEVIIRGPAKDIVIKNPAVSKVKMMGQESWQIVGEAEERGRISEEDVRLVQEQTGVTDAEARAALLETGDLAAAILKLKGK